jgi:hypothetical protein
MPQYIDPGNSSLIWQLLIAGVAGLGFTLRHAVSTLFHRLFSKRGKGPDEPTA